MVSTRNRAYTSASFSSTNIPLPQRTKPKTKLCITCLEDLPTTSFPRTSPTKLCQHNPQICRPCLNTWITTSITTQYRTLLRCPHPDCLEEICPRADIKKGSSHQVRIWEISDRIFKDKNPDWRWCLNPLCDSGQKHVAPQTVGEGWPVPLNLFTCKECKALSCATCDVPWHAGKTCEEYAKGTMRRLVEVRFDEKVIEELKRAGKVRECPDCGCVIEMEGAAGVVRCGRCIYSFDSRII